MDENRKNVRSIDTNDGEMNAIEGKLGAFYEDGGLYTTDANTWFNASDLVAKETAVLPEGKLIIELYDDDDEYCVCYIDGDGNEIGYEKMTLDENGELVESWFENRDGWYPEDYDGAVGDAFKRLENKLCEKVGHPIEMVKPSTTTSHFNADDCIAETESGPLVFRVNHYNDELAIHFFWGDDNTELGWVKAEFTENNDPDYDYEWSLDLCEEGDGFQAYNEIDEPLWEKIKSELASQMKDLMYIVKDETSGETLCFSNREKAMKCAKSMDEEDKENGCLIPKILISHNGEISPLWWLVK